MWQNQMQSQTLRMRQSQWLYGAGPLVVQLQALLPLVVRSSGLCLLMLFAALVLNPSMQLRLVQVWLLVL